MEFKELEQKFRDIDQKQKQLDQYRDKVNAEIVQARADFAKEKQLLIADINTLIDQKTALLQDIEMNQNVFQKKTKELTELNDSVKQTSSRLDDFILMIEGKKREFAADEEKRIENAKVSEQKIIDQMTVLSSQKTRAQEDFRLLMEHRETAGKSIDELLEYHKLLQGKVTSLEIRIVDLTQTLDRMTAGIQEDQRILDAAVGQIEAKREEIQNLEQTKQTLSEEIAALQEEKIGIAQAQEANTKRSADLAAWEQELKIRAKALANRKAELNQKEREIKEALTTI